MAIDTGDTTWVLIASALVLLMTPGLALFYGGLVRKKNVLSATMHSYIAIVLISIEWAIIGFSLAFGPDKFGIIGGLSFFSLHGVGLEPNANYASTIPAMLFMVFQMMFAIITPALISGAVAERMRFGAYMLFIILWALIPYNLTAHWVWGVGGWLRNLGVLDFSGGTVVHILAGVSSLVAALFLGNRTSTPNTSFSPHNLPMATLGAGILWFGWFGFNAGSALGANEIAVLAFVNTHISAAAAAAAWLLLEYLNTGKLTTLGAICGALSGLVAITPGAGFVAPMSSILIGFIGGIVCYLAIVIVKTRLGYDDSLDAFGVHGVGGTWGVIATGLFATTTVNPGGNNGLFYGNAALLGTQLIAIIATIAVAIAATYIILKVVSLVTPLRVTKDEEENGLDISLHKEKAYGDFVSDTN